MARWTGDEAVGAVLEGADAWRERCFTQSGSILSDGQLWTLENLRDLHQRFVGNPLEGSRDFIDKLKEQLTGSPPGVMQLAAEALWFLFLFPSPRLMGAEKKRDVISEVWSALLHNSDRGGFTT